MTTSTAALIRGVRQPRVFVDEGLGNSSYLLDLGDGRALAVDPSRDASPYLAEADRAGLTIGFSVETHLHADFLTGSRELAARGATVLAPRGGQIEWPHRGFSDGDVLDLGGLSLEAIGTPGHTPEHLSWLLLDGTDPVALFSGGALLPDAVARTDLISPDQTEPLARALWHSLQERILTLPDDLPVLPTHGAGSFCSAPTHGERTTTIGRERRANPLLAQPDEDSFVAALLRSYGSYPTYFLRMRERNRRGPEVLGAPFPPLPSLSAPALRRVLETGGLLIDARPVRSWAKGHLRGSLAIPLRPQFGSWLGWLVPDERPLSFLLEDGQDAYELARQARTVGYDDLAGIVRFDMAALEAVELEIVTTPLIPAPQLVGPVVDVRQHHEFGEGHVPGAVHVELGKLPGQLAEVPDGPVAAMCGHGERAATAASLLERAGRQDVSVVVGGVGDWAEGHR